LCEVNGRNRDPTSNIYNKRVDFLEVPECSISIVKFSLVQGQNRN
jgi:hypothetical protein